MSTDSVLDDLRLDIRLTDAPHDRTSYVPPWTTTMSMSPRQLLGSTTTMAPSFGPLGTPARLTSGARLIHSPPVWVDGTPSTALPSGAYKHDLQDALVQASCRSNTWEELAPPILGHHPFRSGVAAADASAANFPVLLTLLAFCLLSLSCLRARHGGGVCMPRWHKNMHVLLAKEGEVENAAIKNV